jgi:hypothetical protein
MHARQVDPRFPKARFLKENMEIGFTHPHKPHFFSPKSDAATIADAKASISGEIGGSGITIALRPRVPQSN